MAFISGWGGRVVLSTQSPGAESGTAMSVSRWSVAVKTDPVDSTTMNGVGFFDAIDGVTEFDISLSCFYETSINPYQLADSNLLMSGAWNPKTKSDSTFYIGATLYIDRAGTRQYFYFPHIIVTDVTWEDEVRGVANYTIQGKATLQPDYTYQFLLWLGGVSGLPSPPGPKLNYPLPFGFNPPGFAGGSESEEAFDDGGDK